MAVFGKYLWWAVGLLVLSAVLFLLPSVDGRHLRATSTNDPVKIITAITGLLSAIAVLIGAIDKLRSGKKAPPDDSKQPNDREDYETPRGTRPTKRFSRGDELEYVRPDWRDKIFNLVEVRRFLEYDHEGYEVWTVVDKYLEPRRKIARRR